MCSSVAFTRQSIVINHTFVLPSVTISTIKHYWSSQEVVILPEIARVSGAESEGTYGSYVATCNTWRHEPKATHI